MYFVIRLSFVTWEYKRLKANLLNANYFDKTKVEVCIEQKGCAKSLITSSAEKLMNFITCLFIYFNRFRKLVCYQC